MKRESKRFQPSSLTRFLVPAVLGLLLLGLLTVVGLVALALFGVFPGG